MFFMQVISTAASNMKPHQGFHVEGRVATFFLLLKVRNVLLRVARNVLSTSAGGDFLVSFPSSGFPAAAPTGVGFSVCLALVVLWLL